MRIVEMNKKVEMSRLRRRRLRLGGPLTHKVLKNSFSKKNIFLHLIFQKKVLEYIVGLRAEIHLGVCKSTRAGFVTPVPEKQ